MQTKICSKCNKEKPLSDFYKHEKGKFGVHSICKCCRIEYQKTYKENHPNFARESWLECNYGITLNEYHKLSEEQNNLCLICGNEEIVIDKRLNKKRSLAVDHNHKTGKVRGLLCTSCNHLLGNANDNIQILEKAITYLKDNEE
jgi:hypothetical protein